MAIISENIEHLWDGEVLWQNDFKINKGDDGQYSYSQSYLVREDLLTIPTKVWSPEMTEYFSNMSLANSKFVQKSLRIKNEGGKVFRVSLTYGSPQYEDTSKDDKPTNTPEQEQWEMNQVRTNKSIQTQISYSTEPILSAYVLRDVNGKSKISLADSIFMIFYLDGKLIQDGNGKWKHISDKKEKQGYLSEPTNIVWQNYVKLGYKVISVPYRTITVSYATNNPDLTLDSKVGKIVKLDGFNDKTSDGYVINHLLTSFDVSYNGNNFYQCQEVYLESQPGGWNKEIYN